MATILKMIQNRLPDEAELFFDSLEDYIEEARALSGYDSLPEADLQVLQKSLISDMAALALILPAKSKYKKSLASAEGEGSGTAEWVNKLKFLESMQAELKIAISEKKSKLDDETSDKGWPMVMNND